MKVEPILRRLAVLRTLPRPRLRFGETMFGVDLRSTAIFIASLMPAERVAFRRRALERLTARGTL